MSKTYTITHKRLMGLLECELLLEALETQGVDNWLGYDEARSSAEYRAECEKLATSDALAEFVR